MKLTVQLNYRPGKALHRSSRVQFDQRGPLAAGEREKKRKVPCRTHLGGPNFAFVRRGEDVELSVAGPLRTLIDVHSS